MTASTKTVVFIDPNVADWQDLVNGVEPGSLVFILDPQRDGISQITDKLAALTDIDSVQIISHGGEGSLSLGSSVLNSANLNGYSSQLQQWGKSLTATGDILLYGCDVAQGLVGKAFVQQISQLTGADVAASDDLTGSAALGGDWVLEYATGLIEAPLALQVQAMEAYSSTFTFTLVGEFLTRAYGVQVVGNYAYVANAYSGLQIIDISNPTTPSLKGNYDTSDHAWGVQVMGNYAYVADGESGLQIIDISNPTTPILKGNYDTSGTATVGVQVVGNYAYVADQFHGLSIINVDDTFLEYNGSRYLLTGQGTWEQTQAQAESLGGNLVTVNNQAEQDWLVTTFGGTEPLWTGLTDKDIAGQYKWASGETSTYTNWYPGEPSSSADHVQDYVYINYKQPGKWDDLGNELQLRGIIEIVLPTITLAVSPSSVTENGTANLVYTFTRTGATTNILTINYGITGTADSTDYTGATPGTGKTITFAAGASTATLTINPTADTTVESNETVLLTLASGTGYTIGTTTAVTGTIINDDTVFEYNGSRYLLTGQGTWEETQAQAQSLGGNLVTVNNQAEQDWLVTTFGGTDGLWTGLTDKVTEGQFKWASGETSTYTNWYPGEPNNGGGNEDYVGMNYGGAGIWNDFASTASFKGIIEIVLPTITLAVSPSSVTEDGTANLVYTFTRTGATTNALTINYGIAGTANSSDYTGATPGTGKTITFAAGASTATLTIDPTADTTIESNETVALTLATGTGYTVGTTTAVTGTITNDDTGNTYTAIESAGNTKLVKDPTNKYFTQVGTNTPIAIKNGGQQIYQDIYGSGWQTIAAETVNGVNQVLWKNIPGNYLHIWHLDNNWNWVSSEGNWGLNSAEALTQETKFGIDANGDGKIGSPSSLTLTGTIGNDILIGGANSDTFNGGLGNDTLYLGLNDNAVDNVNYASGDGTDTVYQFVRGVGGDKLNFTGIANLDVVTLGANTEVRIGDGIAANTGFGTGQLLTTLSSTTGLTGADVNVNLFGANFLFS